MADDWPDDARLAIAYEDFLSGGSSEAEIRKPILTSWQRCKSLGLASNPAAIPYRPDLDPDSPLLRAAAPVLDRLTATLQAYRVSAILTDAQATVLRRCTTDRDLDTALETIRIAPGFAFPEEIAGTNGIGTALAERRPCYVFGREHFADCMEPFACAAAPIRNRLSGRIEGVLDLTCRRADAHSMMVALAHQAAEEIAQELLDQTSEREHSLLAAFLARDDTTASPPNPFRWNGTVAVPRRSTGAPSWFRDALSSRDQAFVLEKAAELISSPHQETTRVHLADGRTVTLACRAVTGRAGENGVAVEAGLVHGPGRPRCAVSLPAPAGASPLPGAVDTPVRTAPAGTVGEREAAAPDREADPWLLLVGEPGVGQLALLARRRLELLHQACIRIGTTLDVARTAEELAEVAVPRFADAAAVDLPSSVLLGEEPVQVGEGLRRVALRGSGAADLYAIGDLVHYRPSTPQSRCLAGERAVLEPGLRQACGWAAQDPERAARILDAGFHSLITVPLRARGVVLGLVTFLRSANSAGFEDDDLALAEEIVGLAAVCIDNARRYTREHAMALALQHSLLPRGLPEQRAVEVAHRYLPAHAQVGGDWYDIIPLSGARVALVVGDVVGHGIHAAATMGRLRTAIHNFSSLDLPADELLARLDELVDRLDRDRCIPDTGSGDGIVGATCLYAIYDPVTRQCTMARAGHPLPALVRPDGSVEFPDLPAGAPLGLGGTPFETAELEIPEGSRLVLYTDGLIEDRSRDLDEGLERLRGVLTHAAPDPEETCDRVLRDMLPPRPGDDVALLVARTHALDTTRYAQWDLPADPSVVAEMRAAAGEQLARWGLEHLAFPTELVISELLTNAIRHAREPIRLRLVRDHALICEVSDGSSTSPRLRRAATTDEGGRGLFLTSQFVTRWGTRYTPTGKIIWAEQATGDGGG